MIVIKEYTKKVIIKDYDYFFDKYKNFLKLKPYITPKIEGSWSIILLNLKLEEVEEMLNGFDYGNYATITIYLEKDIVEKVLERYPKAVFNKMSGWDNYLAFLSTVPIKIEPKAVNEIYKRCFRSLEKVQEELPRIIEKSDGVITLKDVNKCLIENNIIYASQVVKEFLMLDKYRWKHFEILRRDIGDKMAFYAMRKYLRKLVIEKNKYLNNQETKERDITRIDVYTISHASLQFELASNYACIASCLLSIERRRSNANEIY